MSTHGLHAIQASLTFLLHISMELEVQATQNEESQAARTPVEGARDCEAVWEGKGGVTRRPEWDFPLLHAIRI